MDDFESVFNQEDGEINRLKEELRQIKEDLALQNPQSVSSQVSNELKRLTRKTYVGDGSTGNANFDGSSAVTGTTRSGTTYTLTGDVQYNNVTVAENVVVVGRQYLMFVKGNLINKGTIYANGGWW